MSASTGNRTSTSFTWDDSTPVPCAILADCLPQGTVTGVFQFDTRNVFLTAPGVARADDTLFAGNMLFTHVTMEPQPAPVPEPATASLITVGLMAILAIRRDQSTCSRIRND